MRGFLFRQILFSLLIGPSAFALCPPSDPVCGRSMTYVDPQTGETFMQAPPRWDGDVMVPGEGWVKIEPNPNPPAGSAGLAHECKPSDGPNCRSQQGPQEAGNKQNEESQRLAACRAQVYRWASQCAAANSSASQSCSEEQETQAFESGTAQANQELSQKNSNNNQACQAAANSYQNTASQLTGLASSCQSAVTQCANSCAQMRAALSSCPDSQAQQRAQSLSGASAACSSGGSLAQRPAQITNRSSALRDSAARTTQECTNQTQASSLPNQGDSGLGKRAQEVTETAPNDSLRAELAASPKGPQATGRTPSATGTDLQGTSFRGPEDAIDVSGRGVSAKAAGYMSPSESLASLPQTPTLSSSNNTEEVKSEVVDGTAGSSGTYGSSRAGKRLFRPAARGGLTAAEAVMDTEDKVNAAEEGPDLSAFLPSGRRGLAGSTIANLSGCRIPDPSNPRQCAVPHGPSANIWSKMKERFEEFRFMRPSQFFMNEE